MTVTPAAVYTPASVGSSPIWIVTSFIPGTIFSRILITFSIPLITPAISLSEPIIPWIFSNNSGNCPTLIEVIPKLLITSCTDFFPYIGIFVPAISLTVTSDKSMLAYFSPDAVIPTISPIAFASSGEAVNIGASKLSP